MDITSLLTQKRMMTCELAGVKKTLFHSLKVDYIGHEKCNTRIHVMVADKSNQCVQRNISLCGVRDNCRST